MKKTKITKITKIKINSNSQDKSGNIYKESENKFREKTSFFNSGGQAEIYDCRTYKKSKDNPRRYLQIKTQHPRLIKVEKISEQRIEYVLKRREYFARKVRHLHNKVTPIRLNQNEWELNTLMYKFPGETFYNVLRNNKMGKNTLSAGLRLEIVRKISLAIKYSVHDLNIVHRDIKANNIILLIDYEAQKVLDVHIIDYDLAKISKEIEEDSRCGTSSYLSPEASQKKNTTFKSDIFSLAMDFGILFSGNSKKIRRNKHNQSNSSFRPDFSGLFQGISDFSEEEKRNIALLLDKMTELDESSRYGINEVIIACLNIELKKALHPLWHDSVRTNFILAHKNACRLQYNLRCLMNQFQSQKLDYDTYINWMEQLIKNELNHLLYESSINQFINILGIKLFYFLGQQTISNKLDQTINQFKYYRSILSSILFEQDSIYCLNHPVIVEVAYKCSKKLYKCLTLDEMQEFNLYFKDKIAFLAQQHKITITQHIVGREEIFSLKVYLLQFSFDIKDKEFVGFLRAIKDSLLKKIDDLIYSSQQLSPEQVEKNIEILNYGLFIRINSFEDLKQFLCETIENFIYYREKFLFLAKNYEEVNVLDICQCKNFRDIYQFNSNFNFKYDIYFQDGLVWEKYVNQKIKESNSYNDLIAILNAINQTSFDVRVQQRNVFPGFFNQNEMDPKMRVMKTLQARVLQIVKQIQMTGMDTERILHDYQWFFWENDKALRDALGMPLVLQPSLKTQNQRR